MSETRTQTRRCFENGDKRSVFLERVKMLGFLWGLHMSKCCYGVPPEDHSRIKITFRWFVDQFGQLDKVLVKTQEGGGNYNFSHKLC